MSNDTKPLPNPLATPPNARPVGGIATSNSGTAPGNNRDALLLLLNSRCPIITIETAEEQRACDLLEQVANELNISLFVWSVTEGLARAHGVGLYNSDQPEQALSNISTIPGDAIFVLKDFARYCDNDRVSRRLRDAADGCLLHAAP